jgi:methionyl aminopeptidase
MAGKIRLKTREEIEKIKEANQIIARLYEEVLPSKIIPGITTNEINTIIEEYIKSQGGRPATIGVVGEISIYPAGSCLSVNEAVVHGIPSDRVLVEGDIISVDTVVELNGYYGDAAITFPVGEIDEESKKLLEVTRKALEIGIEECYVGNRLGDLGNAIESYVKKNKFTVVKDFCGHGVGFSMHEEPMIMNFGRKGRGIKIEEGMVLAIEPMVNSGSYKVGILNDGWTAVTKDGKKSAHFEHSVAIIDGKAVILSKLEK